ncbi:MAG: carbohydrate-binding protein [Deefgea sp.]
MSILNTFFLPLLLISSSIWAASPWHEGRQYQQGEIVSYQGRTYKALQAHKAERGANWNPSAAPSLWTAFEINRPSFSWQEGKQYRQGQIVEYRGRSYRVRQAHKAERGANWNPEAAASLWEPIEDIQLPRN